VRSSLKKLGLFLASVTTAAGLAVSLAPTAQASGPACPSGQQVHTGEVHGNLVKRNPLDRARPAYSVTYRWCTAGGEVRGFVVGRVHEDPGVKLDIQPDQPLVWGPTYPVSVHVSGNSTKGQDWSIVLNGNGSQQANKA
jgi:hypothetical protein